jgi:hypothetical protein
MNFNEKLEELNKKLGSKITKRMGVDKMYQRSCVEFLNENGDIFFKAIPSEPLILNPPETPTEENMGEIEKLYKEHSEDWELNTILSLENRYKELYQK